MPVIVYGNIWSVWGHTDMLCITTNACVRRDGRLVMGAGIAKEAARRFPDLPLHAGTAVGPDMAFYGLLIFEINGNRLGLFQTKCDWGSKSDISIISHSADKLISWIHREEEESHRLDAISMGRSKYAVAREHQLGIRRVDLNFPGIGLGGLSFLEVIPALRKLPDCVNIWVTDRTQRDGIDAAMKA